MIRELPFQLSKGFFLERRQVLLPWNSKVKQLFYIGTPDAIERTGTVFLDWRYDRCLDGLPATVHAQLRRSQKFREVQLMTCLPQIDFTAHVNFERVNKHLISIFGEPDRISTIMDFPIYEWIGEQLEISHFIFERFGEYCVLKIRRKGPV